MPTLRRLRRAVFAGAASAAILLLTSCTAEKSHAPAPTPNAITVDSPTASTPTSGADTSDVVNTALERAADAIGEHVATQCGKGSDPCRKVLAEANDDYAMTWGDDSFPVVFFEDGSWSIEQVAPATPTAR
ncbi:hypothetical protein U9R90_26995 [Streptomyces sp. E11-3]|uniref:hypothetical protein n=1 Tax=Streptomyces sp. E11-3 TaxID=3110112 RepID=UPI00397F588A